MKNLIIILSLVFTTFLMNAQSENKGVAVTVVIDNIQNNDGKVMLALHTAETFMKGPGIQNTTSEIENGKAKVTFENVPEGTYAIMALHDANNNNRMDFEVSGMPKESYGMSNNDMSFGPPKFGAAKFEVKDTSLDLTIRF